jgi:hypothetical protein
VCLDHRALNEANYGGMNLTPCSCPSQDVVQHDEAFQPKVMAALELRVGEVG